MSRSMFPIMLPDSRDDRAEVHAAGVDMLRAIPWDMIAPHEQQAERNHGGQSLAGLAGRGGLSACEAVAVLEDRQWKRMPLVDAYKRLNELFVVSTDSRG